MIGPFRGKHRFLSNFYPSPILVDGIWFPSVEHAYQAAKTDRMDIRQTIASITRPGQAKEVGRQIAIRSNWESVKVPVMRALVAEKFKRNFEPGELAEKLLDTGSEELVEVNDWGDHFWGVCNGVGENHLGKILMAVRDELVPF